MAAVAGSGVGDMLGRDESMFSLMIVRCVVVDGFVLSDWEALLPTALPGLLGAMSDVKLEDLRVARKMMKRTSGG